MLADLFGWLRADTSGGAELVDLDTALFQPRRRLRPARQPRKPDSPSAQAFHRILITEARKRKESK